jgi:hypothetical protein
VDEGRTKMETYLAFDTAIEPPTPPPTAAAMTTMASMTASQNVDLRTPQMLGGLFGTPLSSPPTEGDSLFDGSD